MPEDIEVAPDSAKQPSSILVVEDKVDLRFTLAEWFRGLGYIVYEAATADEAVKVLHTPVAIDLVITDVDMPGTMDGITLAEHIKETKSRIDVVVVSGTLHPAIQEKDLTFFRKPYDLDELASHVAKVLNIRLYE